MKRPSIILPNGDLFHIETIIQFVGFQMEHKITGRLLPTCSRHEIYSKHKMFVKFNEVISVGIISMNEIAEWALIPITDIELEEVSGYIIVE